MTDSIESVYREESRHVLATLIRLLGDFDLAEDALQQAFLAAAERWPRDGAPHNPRAWLISTGRFQAIDALRRRARFTELEPRIKADMQPNDELNVALDHVPDDDLRLIFLCCHPALSLDSQIVLTLREACGLKTEEIATAFLSKPATIAQRIVRAKQRIRDAELPYELPPNPDLPARLQGVLHVIYLLFNEGYEASSGPALLRVDLCGEAIRLATLIAEILPDPEVFALLALMTFHHARRASRTDANGDIVLLEEQDRAQWDRAQLERGTQFLARAVRERHTGRYAVEASIAAVHVAAPTSEATNWAGIVQLYDALLDLEPSPVVELNRAAAIAMRDGPAAGLALVEELLQRPDLRDYRFAHAARADMYRRLGRAGDARAAYETALALTTQAAERRFLEKRLSRLDPQSPLPS
ncbi:MAG TPA: RNA polymerase sigma factor [Verrucomicrobiae bacterium]|nr:RNA polymerase sigma factor [Verrucomicrobiae bacterium]HTZ53746.1 RNA polymerase sigma factor [Candidatus Acidoferrum sp.]